MPNLLVVLCIVAFVLAIITLVGHGLWLLGTAIMRALGIVDPPVGRGLPCYQCGHSTALKQGVCENCGYRTVAAQRRDVQTAINLVNHLHATGKLPDVDFQSVRSSLQSLVVELQAAHQVDGGRQAELHPMPSHPPVFGAASQATADKSSSSPVDQLDGHGEQPSPSARAETDLPLTSPDTVDQLDKSAMPDDDWVEAEIVFDEVRQHATPQPVARHPLDATPDELDSTVATTPQVGTARRTLADMLQSFMEEKNIRWGELASGILIVGSAIGLVISLRAKLAEISEQIQYFPALLFMLGTVAIHAAGLYTLKRWKLRSTSRGVLVIATLLVPLSFAAGIVMSGVGENRTPVTSPLYIAAVIVGMLVYAAVTTFSARALFAEGWWRLTVVVIGTSAGQLVINRLADVHTRWPLLAATALFALPLASYLAATLSQLHAVSRKRRLTPTRAAQTYTVLGIAVFALAVPLGLQAWVSGAVRGTFTFLSPSLAVAAAVVLSLGSTVQQRCDSRRLAETRTAGTALAVLGGMMMCATLMLAWPSPEILTLVATVTAAALATLAVMGRLPILHAGAAAAGSFAILLLFHHISGQFAADRPAIGEDVIRAIMMGRSAWVLVIPALVCGSIGAICRLRKLAATAHVYLLSAAGISAVSLSIAIYAGFWSGVDVNLITPLLAAYAVVVLAASPMAAQRWVTSIGCTLLLVTLIHLCQFNHWLADWLARRDYRLAHPILLSFIIHGLLVECYGLGLWGWQRLQGVSEPTSSVPSLQRRSVIQPLAVAGAMTAALAAPFLLFVSTSALGTYALYALGIAVTWAVAAGVVSDARLVTASHAAFTLAITFSISAFALRQDWSQQPLLDLRHWQWQLSVLSLWCGLASVIRLACRKLPRVRQLLNPDWPAFDQILLGFLVIGLVILAAIGCTVGTWLELGFISPQNLSVTDTWHTVAHQPGSWVALACLLIALGLSLIEEITVLRLSALAIATVAVPLLLASKCEPSVSVASMLRWSFAGYTLLWSGLVAFRTPIRRLVSNILPTRSVPEPASRAIRDLSLSLGVTPVVVLTGLAMGQFIQGSPLYGPIPGTFFGDMTSTVLFGIPLLSVGVALFGLALRDGQSVLALLGSLVLQYAIVLAVLIPVYGDKGVWTAQVGVVLTQWVACGLAGYALIWWFCRRWIDRHDAAQDNQLLLTQLAAASVASLGLCLWSVSEIFLRRINSKVSLCCWVAGPATWPSC